MVDYGAWLGLLVFGSTVALTGLVRLYALRRGILDQPGPRRSHAIATPRGGGLAIVIIIVGLILLGPWRQAAEIAALMPIAIGVGLIALLGWWDDHRPLSPLSRLLVQTSVCGWVLLTQAPFALPANWAGPALTVAAWVAMVWLINLFNFMDGSDGIAGVQAGCSLALLGWLLKQAEQPVLAAFSGLCAITVAGFLLWNLPLPRARIFMGDVGSATLGFLIAALVLLAWRAGVSIQSLFIVLSVFIVDATATLIMRMLKHERWYTPHRQHAYQRLLRGGWSHGQVLLLYLLLNLVLVMPIVWWIQQEPNAFRAWLGSILTGLVLLGGWSVVQLTFSDGRLRQLNGD